MNAVIRKEIRLSGSGGQGIILAAVTLADAALEAGFYGVQTQSYGPEARGGASKAEVIISDQPIDYPKVTTPDIVLALTSQAYAKYCDDINPGGTMIVEESLSTDDCPDSALRVPILGTAREVGKEIVANMVSLGVLAATLKKHIDKEFIEKSISKRVPPGTEELNIRAFQKGYDMIQ
ncbi:2-oxoacid:acceptor oxidoreductase family protein [Dethiobacter alkaliphilus]|uniref:2-oxoacid:acceptor oxidoreductase family protein n=1 Tax=Dethiobacter alkaliphilus TaxID=427926 RepID=UPI002225CB9C|nr:2-oxoacid:acceptor oxidoreductase family protein [Dethiobacter alkaliphilus]MCW3490742.1 2-oxoacid:acceptor oxidoreductase family protein [Dethiobacter alkaliphilus]